MSEWSARRVWTTASVVPQDGAYTVLLDGRPIRTPAKRPLLLPTPALGEAVADEWRNQGERVDPGTMPFTRSANAAIDKVAIQHAAVAEALSRYAETDLLCYRAPQPEGLAARQTQIWDPLLAWAAEELDARLEPVDGVMPRAQEPATLARLADRVAAMPPFPLTGFHDLVMLSGSLVLAFAVTEERLAAEAAWLASRLDEAWQAEQWGHDEEAEAMAEARRRAFMHAERFHRLSTSPATGHAD